MTGTAARVPVLIGAGSAPWEARAIDLIERSTRLVVHKRCVDLPDVLATASTGLAAAALVGAELPGLDGDSLARLRRDGVASVVVAEPDDHERWLRLRADAVLGADLPGVRAPLVGAVDRTADVPVASPAPETREGAGRLVAVWGPAGAPGRTTVAVGLACASGQETFLLDVDPYGGAVGQHLGVLDEVSGLLAAARSANAGRLDAATLAGHARQVFPGPRVLTGLPRADRWREVRRPGFADLLTVARSIAPLVVADPGFSLDAPGSPSRDAMTTTTVDEADTVVVVGSADPVGLARLARALVELRERVGAVPLHVVVNRTRPSLGWADRDIRGMVEGFVTPLGVHFLPDDRLAADRALMSGRSVTESGDSPLARAMVELAHAVLGAPRPPASKSSRRGHGRRRA